MPRLIDADAFIADARMAGLDTAEKVLFALSHQPTIEPNLILPERMERGECYEVGETIVVMNHDDYYDLLCRATVDKDYLVSLIQEAVYDGEACKRLMDLVDRPQGVWIPCTKSGLPLTEMMRREGQKWYGYRCSNCNYIYKGNALVECNFCKHCGADMRSKIVGKHADFMMIDEAYAKGADDEHDK